MDGRLEYSDCAYFLNETNDAADDDYNLNEKYRKYRNKSYKIIKKKLISGCRIRLS